MAGARAGNQWAQGNDLYRGRIGGEGGVVVNCRAQVPCCVVRSALGGEVTKRNAVTVNLIPVVWGSPHPGPHTVAWQIVGQRKINQ